VAKLLAACILMLITVASLTPASAQRTSPSVEDWDGRGFASLKNFRLGRSRWDGREVDALQFEVTIDRPPPCNTIEPKIEIQHPQGVNFPKPLGRSVTDLQQGKTYTTFVPIEGLGGFRSVRVWLECSAMAGTGGQYLYRVDLPPLRWERPR